MIFKWNSTKMKENARTSRPNPDSRRTSPQFRTFQLFSPTKSPNNLGARPGTTFLRAKNPANTQKNQNNGADASSADANGPATAPPNLRLPRKSSSNTIALPSLFS